MIRHPDSLLTAAKLIADTTGIKWSTVHKDYRALQGDPNKDRGLIPRSSGRQIWAVHPHFGCRILVSLAVASDPSEAIDAVMWAHTLSPDGKRFYPDEMPAAREVCPFETEMSSFLIDPAIASELENVEFQRDRDRAIFNFHEHEPLIFSRSPDAEHSASNRAALIQKRGVISGSVFQELSRKISWRRPDQPPYTKSPQGGVDEEA